MRAALVWAQSTCRMWPESDTDVIKKEINVLAEEVPWQFAILCVITQSFRRVAGDGCRLQRHAAAIKAIPNHQEQRQRRCWSCWSWGNVRYINPSLAIRRPHRGNLWWTLLCLRLSLSLFLSRAEVVKTPTPHKANKRGKGEKEERIFVPVGFVCFLSLSLSLSIPWLPHATLANQWHGTDYSIPYSVFGLRFAWGHSSNDAGARGERERQLKQLFRQVSFLRFVHYALCSLWSFVAAIAAAIVLRQSINTDWLIRGSRR